ncbi:MAG: hypothetical protein DWQ51_17715 [Microcystis wesenbergii TW10]|jgi:ApbE superfamily uncharacterized protein (UPF0280 family)|uniref:Uncharacterized protein n=4 Tax=Microcystis TaxID=1125 RepID=A0A0A1VZF3_MICAE|nr:MULTISPECIES: hypothetical protein [Microcystis]REJ49006.1 MAG: hypothetical protein DWQ51_17715 [Microcystis wesenbergii TW10]TRT85198.1 MAG: hypothetical protein EWV63_13635 [Microcystis aeruginosa Ma_OC_H_19870700_S124]MBD2118346.1 hypothetical protein [Microcystis wesenbergii FACHB-1339]MCZ8040245.1 hypothetical protein [Microcystis sp. LE17-20A]MCZ8212734.1 hypothetical protein [Microcystis sp. LE19-8.1F]
MYSIDITLKLSPIPISVQRKEEAAADALYQTIINAMRSPNPELLELTCEKQTDKKVAVLSDQISAVIVSQKSGAASTGKAPGFVA